MEFTMENINKAHETFTGTDFFKLVHQFSIMGISENEYDIEKGTRVYKHINGKTLEEKGRKANVEINASYKKEEAESALRRHQNAETDFLQFCDEIAEAGVYKWVVNVENTTCNYYDKTENLVISEKIPTI